MVAKRSEIGAFGPALCPCMARRLPQGVKSSHDAEVILQSEEAVAASYAPAKTGAWAVRQRLIVFHADAAEKVRVMIATRTVANPAPAVAKLLEALLSLIHI